MLPSDFRRPNEARLLSPAADVTRDSELLSELIVCVKVATCETRNSGNTRDCQRIAGTMRHNKASLSRTMGLAPRYAAQLYTAFDACGGRTNRRALSTARQQLRRRPLN